VAEHTEHSRYGELDHDFVASLSATGEQEDGPFLMLNLMRYREWADYGDDRPRISGRAADDLYAPLEVLADLGAEVVLFGDVVGQPRGDESWDRVAVVRYPTVRSFLDMQERPDFQAKHVHKAAGMERTVIAVCRPLAGELAAGNRLLVDLVGDSGLQPRPGQLLLEVGGTPVGDGRRWSTLALTPLDGPDADELLVGDGTQATTVVVDALLNALS
jgi:hypothetical protein